MQYREQFRNRLNQLKSENRYRSFVELERQAGRHPHASWNGYSESTWIQRPLAIISICGWLEPDIYCAKHQCPSCQWRLPAALYQRRIFPNVTANVMAAPHAQNVTQIKAHPKQL